MILASCDMVESLDGKVAGYFLMAWDERGGTTCTTKVGGPISLNLLPHHAYSQAKRFEDGDD